MSSGIDVTDECKALFNQFKLKKDLQWLIFTISEDLKKVEVHDVKEKKKKEKPEQGKANKNMSEEEAKFQFEEFKTKLLETDKPQYCIIDINGWVKEATGKRPVTKLVLLNWCSDSLPIKRKMLFASTKQAIKKMEVGIKEINCSGEDDLIYEEILKQAIKAV